VTTKPFGSTVAGAPATLYTLENARGTVARLTDFGAALVELHLADRKGCRADVVLGFDDVGGYEGEENQYFGCVVGRVANRIAGGRFSLDGVEHRLATNDGAHHLHGGAIGFGGRLWRAEVGEEGTRGQALTFLLESPAGEQGYPGRVEVGVTYTLTDADELVLEYEARTDAATPVNLSHHSYFNLSGHGAPTILDHELVIDADRYTPADATLIPTGELAPVEGTPLDFREPRRVGDRIALLEGAGAGGYDHNFTLRGALGEWRRACRVGEARSGRWIEIWTDEPGLQLYSGNFLRGQRGKQGATYAHRSGLCLEAQHFPDSVHQPGFPDTVLRPGEVYRQRTLHRFGVD